MNIEEARGIAARIWCEPKHENKVMDPDMAESFANRLVSEVKRHQDQIKILKKITLRHQDTELLMRKLLAHIARCGCDGAHEVPEELSVDSLEMVREFLRRLDSLGGGDPLAEARAKKLDEECVYLIELAYQGGRKGHKYKELVEKLRTMSTVEMMCENPNVDAHVREWENRCLKAEAEREELRGKWLKMEKTELLQTIQQTVTDVLKSPPISRELEAQVWDEAALYSAPNRDEAVTREVEREQERLRDIFKARAATCRKEVEALRGGGKS